MRLEALRYSGMAMSLQLLHYIFKIRINIRRSKILEGIITLPIPLKASISAYLKGVLE